MSDRELDTPLPAAPPASPPQRRVKSAETEPKNFTLASSVTSPWLRRSSSLGINQHDGPPERGFVADWKLHHRSLALLEQVRRVLAEHQAHLP